MLRFYAGSQTPCEALPRILRHGNSSGIALTATRFTCAVPSDRTQANTRVIRRIDYCSERAGGGDCVASAPRSLAIIRATYWGDFVRLASTL